MAIRLNSDPEVVASIREGLKRTGGYCPCRVDRTEDTKCICREFREQMPPPVLGASPPSLLYKNTKN